MITFQEIGPDNWQTELSVSEEQQKYVDSPLEIMASAWVNRADRSHAYFIVNNTIPVGMVFYCDLPTLNAYNICQIFIDKRYQGNGYGKQALSLTLSMMTEDGKYNQVYVSYISGNEAARKLYESLGFVHTGFEFEGTIDMKRNLTQ